MCPAHANSLAALSGPPLTWSSFFPPEDAFHVPTLALVISASRMPSSPQSSLTHPAPLASFPAHDQEAGCCLLAALGRFVPQLGGRGEHYAPPNEQQAPGRQGPSLLLLSSSQYSKEPCTEQDLQWPPRLSPPFLWSLSFCHLCHHHYYLQTKMPSATWHSWVHLAGTRCSRVEQGGVYSKASVAHRILHRQEPGPGPPHREQCPK